MFDLPLSPRQNSFFKKQFNNKKTVSDKLKPQKKEQTYIVRSNWFVQIDVYCQR